MRWKDVRDLLRAAAWFALLWLGGTAVVYLLYEAVYLIWR